MRSFKVEMVKRTEERFTIANGRLPFLLKVHDSGQVFSDFQAKNVSKSGLGLQMSFHLEPETILLATHQDLQFKLKVVHSTFDPRTQNYRCGLQVVRQDAALDLVQLLMDCDQLG